MSVEFAHGLARLTMLCLAVAWAVAGRPQTLGQPPRSSSPLGQSVGSGIEGFPAGGGMDHEKLLRALNADRQKSLVSDTNKLLRLVKELNDEIARTNPEQLSDAQLRKVAEIEKLARSVREKMSTSVRGSPAFSPVFSPPFQPPE
jgi:hypothetical protein